MVMHRRHQHRQHQHGGYSALEFLLAGGMIVIILALLLPGLQQSRSAAARIRCLNNLNQIAIGTQNYEAMMGMMPPGSVNPVGPIYSEPIGYHMGWTTQLLPFLDQVGLYENLDRTFGAYSTLGMAAASFVPSPLHCTSDPLSADRTASSYAGCIGGTSRQIDDDNTGLLYLNSGVSDREIVDGRSCTLLAGEIRVSERLAQAGLNWMSGTAATLRSSGVDLNSTTDADYEVVSAIAGGFGSWHNGTVSMLFADGAAKSMSVDTDVDILTRMGDRADGQMLEMPDVISENRLRNSALWEAVRKSEAMP